VGWTLAAVACAVVPAAQPAVAVTPNNLLRGVDATFDGGLGSWTAANATVASVTDGVHEGSGAFAVTASKPGPANVGIYSGSGPSTWIPASAGVRYKASLWTRAQGTARTVAPLLAFYDASGSTLDTAWGQSIIDSPDWQQTPTVVGIAPPNTAYVAVDAVVFATLGGETHFFDSAALTSSEFTPARVVGPLHTSGNSIIDGNGARVVLRGLHRFGLEHGTALSNFSSDEITHAQQWGANEVRISLGEQKWLSTNCDYDPAYASQVDSIVNWVTSRGMVALLDLHFNTIAGCTAGDQHMMADQDSIVFWRQVADRYKDNPLVAFDLYNEPHGISDSVWLNGGAVTEAGTTFVAAGMQQLYDAVRSTGATNLVTISGNNWANRLPSTRVTGFNIVYAVHAYTCPSLPPPNCAYASPYDPSSILSNYVAAGATVPVMVTEFGWPNTNDGTYIANVIAFAETQGWGWSVFAWDGATSGRFDLVSSVGPSKGYEPNATATPAVLGFERNAAPPATAPNAPTNVLATAGDSSATVSWAAPDDGGSPITEYTVTASPGGQAAGTDGTARSVVVSGLTNGTAYTFTVRATNAVGTSDASAPSSAVTPTAPASLRVTRPNGGERWSRGSRQTITWSAQSVTGQVKIELLSNGAVVATITSSASATSGSFAWQIPKNLTRRSDYIIRVTSTASPAVTDSSDRTFSIT